MFFFFTDNKKTYKIYKSTQNRDDNSEHNTRYQSLRYLQRACEANLAGENRSFIFTVYVKSVALYHFKLTCVVLHMAVKEFFETIGYVNLESHFWPTLKINCSAEIVSKALKIYF